MSPRGRRALLGAIAAFGVLGCACVLLLADGGKQESFLLSTQLAYTYTPEVRDFPGLVAVGRGRGSGLPVQRGWGVGVI